DGVLPVHLDDAFAAKTAYRGRIAHGLLSASFGSAVVGTILPGAGAIYISQTLGFHLPVRPGDDVTVRIAVITVDQESARVELDRKSTRLNSSHVKISYAVFCLKKKKRNFLM